MKTDWNKRYSVEEYVYGKQPNYFFRTVMDTLSPGKILLPAEGEGRNGVYAACRKWDVMAFDSSPVARQKALKLAGENGVEINYHVCDYPDFNCHESVFDAIAFIYAHLPDKQKHTYYRRLFLCLKTGGKVIFEAFSKNQQKYQLDDPQAGGPRDPGMLFSKEEVEEIFTGFALLKLEEEKILLSEGPGHTGYASVVRCVAEKI
ncbi:class I SAM-dependent methyltransferase [uncultured Proteiniphilum sp.]|mgnify:CR=1 FL=1|uniref:class I SAM-dependent methyltransferase n=1 Tax=uncultured Proteiniphilum sp. TaxID=497637 RepID=UPI00260BC18A|nr:class I SAM-dependent methyltransferase [uncultured Proteiniphilum sp.]